ncbi:MAG TPA: sigma-54 dependent transcriptional regulator [Candidatus Binatia bacterium]|nr:sigma-54 dependent transcriptional regulator [Candidatus Binatia bacterium]
MSTASHYRTSNPEPPCLPLRAAGCVPGRDLPFEGIVGSSPAIGQVLRAIEQVAPTEATVLILGETGTGKELIARAIHARSRRSGRRMIKVNCAALPATLIESELFGRERGAYTGAMTRQEGRFEAADGSTLFLDEIGELSLDAQAKLLRVLQEGEFERLGSTVTHRVNVRVVAATNRDLAAAVRAGTFREDLYYRLGVFPLRVPALRERREDIPALVWSFIAELSQSMGRRVESVSRQSMEALQACTWPGNIRELRNTVERAMIVHDGPVLTLEPPHLESATAAAEVTALEEVERRLSRSILDRTRWRVRGRSGAAELLGLKPTTLESRMLKLGIHRPSSEARL